MMIILSYIIIMIADIHNSGVDACIIQLCRSISVRICGRVVQHYNFHISHAASVWRNGE